MQIDHLPAAPGIYRCQCRICEWTYNGLATNLRTRYKPKPGTEWHHNYLFNRCLAAGHEIVIDVLELCPEEYRERTKSLEDKIVVAFCLQLV